MNQNKRVSPPFQALLSSYVKAAKNPQDFLKRKTEEEELFKEMVGKSRNEFYAGRAQPKNEAAPLNIIGSAQRYTEPSQAQRQPSYVQPQTPLRYEWEPSAAPLTEEEDWWVGITGRPVAELYESKRKNAPIHYIEDVKKPSQTTDSSLLQNVDVHDTLNKKSMSPSLNLAEDASYLSSAFFPSPSAIVSPYSQEKIDYNDPIFLDVYNKLKNDGKGQDLTIAKIDGIYYVDYSKPISNRLNAAEKEFQLHNIIPASVTDGFAPQSPGFSDYDFSSLGNALWFYNQVKDNGPWDIKKEKPWDLQFGNAMKLSNMGDTFIYNGRVFTPEELGNLTYGYLGTAAGWWPEALYLGGGFVQQKNDNGWPAALNPSSYRNDTWGDSPADHDLIQQGIDMYKKTYR